MAVKPSVVLIGDALALDFLNTYVAFPEGPVDFVESGEALLSWMVLVKLIDLSEANKVRQETPPEELNAVATEARELREWFRAFVAERRGHRLSEDALAASERLNALLQGDDTFNTLVAGDDEFGPPLRMRAVRRYRTSRALLLAVAEVLAKFLCDEMLMRVKLCEGPGCRLMFADHTHNSSRRWCSMAMCGNQAKQAARWQKYKGTNAAL